MELTEHLKEFLKSHAGEGFAGKRYLLAVSGGLDSVCLFQLFKSLLPSQIAVAHFNHSLRGEASNADAAHVQALCEKQGVDFKIGVRPQGGSKDEASLRDDRHRFLEQACFALKCDFIVTGHHLDDQLETILMRLLRGTGMDGLQGIAPQRGHWLRPLLSTSRAKLEALASENQWEFRTDESNQDPTYFRNRIRSQLVPVFFDLSHAHGGPENFLSRLGGLTEELRAAEDALEEKNRALYVHIATFTPFWLRIDLALFFRLPTFWRHRFLRSALKRLGVPTLDRLDTQRLCEMIETKVPAASFTGVRFFQSCGYAYLQTREQGAYASRPRRLIQEGRKISVPDLEISFTLPPGDWEARFYEPGDKILGKKLKEFFLFHRVPQPERRLIPLLVRPGEKEIAWLYPQPFPGLEIHNSAFPFVGLPTTNQLRH